MVDIRIDLIPTVQNNPQGSGNQQKPLSFKNGKREGRERRRNKLDRRQSVRDGLVVTLSTQTQTDRRQGSDRRKK